MADPRTLLRVKAQVFEANGREVRVTGGFDARLGVGTAVDDDRHTDNFSTGRLERRNGGKR